MSNKVEYAFPAGDESDGSNDEWDIGFSKSIKVPLIKVTYFLFVSPIAYLSSCARAS